MLQVGQQAGFSLEGLAEPRIGAERFLDGDRATQPLIQRLVDSAHTTLADGTDDEIAILQHGTEASTATTSIY